MPADSLPDVSVVILNFDGRHIIDRCLQSALALDYPSDRLEVIVCDNGSSDGSVEYVRTRFPSVRLVPLDRNYGFAEGNNRALAACRFQWVAFINNDMWFAPSWLRKLVAPLATQPALACIAGRILDWDGSHIDFQSRRPWIPPRSRSHAIRPGQGSAGDRSVRRSDADPTGPIPSPWRI